MRPLDLSQFVIRLEQDERSILTKNIQAGILAWEQSHVLCDQGHLPLAGFDEHMEAKPIEVAQVWAWHKITDKVLDSLRGEKAPETIVAKVRAWKDRNFANRDRLSKELVSIPGEADLEHWRDPVLNNAQVCASWANAPIRRVDAIELGKNALSHRDQAAKLFAPRKPSSAAGPAPAPPPPGPTNPQVPPAGIPPIPQPQATTPNKQDNPASPNNLDRERYLSEPPEQVRRLPVKIVLIIEPDHVEQVLAALVNSPLRFQTCEYALERAPGVHPPADPLKPKPPGLGPCAGASAPSGPASDADPNLLKFTIWGVVPLYEPCPELPRPATPIPQNKPR